MRQYYKNEWTKVVDNLGTCIHKGLLEYECILRREEFGENRIKVENKGKIKKLFMDTVNKFSFTIIGLAMIILLVNKSYLLLIVNTIILTINAIVKLLFNIRKRKRQLFNSTLDNIEVTVLREGVQRQVKAYELVRGDIVKLKGNSYVSADMRIIDSENLLVDEQIVTGDTKLQVKKEQKLYEEPKSIKEVSNMVFAGSMVKSGCGTGVVVATGNSTLVGNIQNTLGSNPSKNEIYEIAERFIFKIQAIFMFILAAIYLFMVINNRMEESLLLQGIFISSGLLISIIGYVFYKVTFFEFKESGIILNNISSIKDSNDIKIMFLDKMGSVTEEEMIVKRFYTNEHHIDTFKLDVNEINTKRLLDIAFINSAIYKNNKDIRETIYTMAYKGFMKERNINTSQVEREYPMKFKIQTDSNLVTTVVKTRRGYRANTKGPVQEVLSKCTYILINGIERPITQVETEKIKVAEVFFSNECLITEACAYRSFTYEPSKDENIENNLVFVGLISLENPLKEDVRENINNLFDEGVLPIVFSEDNTVYAEKIGKRIGLIATGEEVVSGFELSYLSGKELYKKISKVRVYSRLTEKQKNLIISTYIKDGFKVSMEGSNINDASLMSSCNLGVVRNGAPLILSKTSDVSTDESILKTILKLRGKGRDFNSTLNFTASCYLKVLINIFTAIFSYYILKEKMLYNDIGISILALFITVPILALSLIKCKRENIKGHWINILLAAGVVIISTWLIKEEQEFLIYFIIGTISIVDIIDNVNIDFKTFNLNLKLFIVSILVMLLGALMMYILNATIVNLNVLLWCVLPAVFYKILIFIMRKWQY